MVTNGNLLLITREFALIDFPLTINTLVPERADARVTVDTIDTVTIVDTRELRTVILAFLDFAMRQPSPVVGLIGIGIVKPYTVAIRNNVGVDGALAIVGAIDCIANAAARTVGRVDKIITLERAFHVLNRQHVR